MKKHFVFPLLAILLCFVSCSTSTKDSAEITLDEIASQLRLLEEHIISVREEQPLTNRGNKRVVPRTINEDGNMLLQQAEL